MEKYEDYAYEQYPDEIVLNMPKYGSRNIQIFLDNLESEVRTPNKSKNSKSFKQIEISPNVFDKFDLEECFERLDEIERRGRKGKVLDVSSQRNLEKSLKHAKSSVDIKNLSKAFSRSRSRGGVRNRSRSTKEIRNTRSGIFGQGRSKSRSRTPELVSRSRVASPFDKINRMKMYDEKRKKNKNHKEYLKIQTKKFKKHEEKKLEEIRSEKTKRLEKNLDIMRFSKINRRSPHGQPKPNKKLRRRDSETLEELLENTGLKILFSEKSKSGGGNGASREWISPERRSKLKPGMVHRMSQIFQNELSIDRIDKRKGRSEKIPWRRNDRIRGN